MDLQELLDRFQPDFETIEQGRRRQAAVWRGERPDFLPLLLVGELPKDLKGLPRYNLKECFYDKSKMLWNALLDMIAVCEAKSDACPSMRANLGCGIMATVFGVEQMVFEDKMPWIIRHLTKEEIGQADVSLPHTRGDIPRVLEYMAWFKEQLAGRAAVYCSDCQGPFDIAHLVYGDEIFTEMYDDPGFVHDLMAKVSEVYISVVKAMKAVNGERLDESYHYNHLYIDGAGTRSSEDTTTLISPSLVREFALPYTERCFRPFGKGYVHYCGNGENLRPFLMKMECVAGLNLGDPQKHDLPAVIRDLLACGKVYYGTIPRNDGEPLKEYFERVLGMLGGERRGLIFQPKILPEDGHPAKILDLWRSLQ